MEIVTVIFGLFSLQTHQTYLNFSILNARCSTLSEVAMTASGLNKLGTWIGTFLIFVGREIGDPSPIDLELELNEITLHDLLKDFTLGDSKKLFKIINDEWNVSAQS